MNISDALRQYNEVAELPRGYVIQPGNTHHPCELELRSERDSIGYPLSAPDMTALYYAVVYGYGLSTARSMAWQHALDLKLDSALDDDLSDFYNIVSVTVSSASGLTSVKLHKFPLPSGPRFVAAEITIQRGPITLKSHARDVSIGQIVAAIAG
jgi:hypothetical protein